MPTFTYTARDQKGSVQAGNLEALDEDQVVAMLQHRGLLVTSVSLKDVMAPQRQAAARVRARARRMHGSVKTEDHVLLCQQLATLVDAGIPLLRALEVASAQVTSRPLLLALDAIRGDVEGGKSLSDGLARHPRIFSKLWINLVDTGEASGHLAQSLQQLARHYESAQHLQNEAKTALTYPAVLMVAAAGVLALFVYWLIPKFTSMFESMNMELPLITQIVIGVSRGAQRYWWLILGGGGGAVFVIRSYLRTEAGQWTRDRALLSVPVFKQLVHSLQLAEFARGLSTLLESGVPLLSALELLESSATNKLYGRAIGEVRESVREGKSLAEPMDRTGFFPSMVVQMVQVGEEVGELGKMAGRVAAYYETQVEAFIARLTRLFEPFAIVGMGVLVLVIVLSIFMPIFNMANMKAGG